MTEGRFYKMLSNYDLNGDSEKFLIVGPLETAIYYGSEKRIANIDIHEIRKYAVTFTKELDELEDVDYDVVIIMTCGELEEYFSISARVIEKINCKRIIIFNTDFAGILNSSNETATNSIDITYKIHTCEESFHLRDDYQCYLKPDGTFLINPFPYEAESAYEIFDNNYIDMYYPEGFRDLAATYSHALDYYNDFLDDLDEDTGKFDTDFFFDELYKDYESFYISHYKVENKNGRKQIYEVYRYEFFQEIRDKISLSPVKIPNEEFYRFDKQDRINYAIADFQ